MRLLLGLPDELLLQIIECTSAGDISSLASCCRRLKELAIKRINFHKDMRATAARVVVGWGPSGTFNGPKYPAIHLLDILENNDLRFYTKVMEIGYLSDGGGVSDSGSEYETEDNIKNHAAVTARIKHLYGHQLSELVTNVHKAALTDLEMADLKIWTDHIFDGDPAAVVVLLLALYQNLETLYIHDVYSETWYQMTGPMEIESHIIGNQSVEEVATVKKDVSREVYVEEEETLKSPWLGSHWGAILQSLLAAAAEAFNNEMKIFSKLSELEILGQEEEDELHANAAELFTLFIPLRSMRRVIGRAICGDFCEQDFNAQETEITVLDLDGHMNRCHLLGIIHATKQLRHFSYRYYTPQVKYDNAAASGMDENYFARWKPRIITTALLQCACDSLVSLCLTAECYRGVEFQSDELSIGSLRQFRALKDVCVNTLLLFRKMEHPSNSLMIEKSTVAQRLVDFLPYTIESFMVTCEYVGNVLTKNDIATMFTSLPERKDRLPSLSHIKLGWRGHWTADKLSSLEMEKEGWEELKLRCKDNSIRLTCTPYGHP